MNDRDWQPNEAAPGEMYTPEGQIKAAGALARGLAHPDPRGRTYRRQMQRTGLLFVAAVGLGPFAGVLGIALHTWGSAAKNFADAIENVSLEPFEAVRSTGASRGTALVYAVRPDVLPVLLSTALFWWEFNVRASTVLGVVGAGGIGQELKSSMDLLDFPRLFTIIVVIVLVVTLLDRFSGWLRSRLT